VFALKRFPRLRKILLWCLGIAMVVVILLFLGVVSGIIGVHLPRPSGPYAVGRAHYDLIDPQRREMFVDDPSARREIVATIYYPAQPPPRAKPAPYVAGEMARFLAGRVHLPAMTANLIHCHAYENMPIEDGKYPAVLFFPGIGTAPVEYTSTVEGLASHGYVVAVVYPTYSVAVTVFADGRVAPLNDAGFRCENEPPGTTEEQIEADRDAIGSVWVSDARFVLDQLAKLCADDHLLRGHLDTSKVGIVGHSFGGATAAEVVRIDERFRAGINLDGTPFRMTAQGPITRPILWMTSDYSTTTDQQLERIGMSREEFDAKLQKRQRQRQPYARLLKRGGRLKLKGSTHNTFISDDALLSAIIPGMSDPLASIEGPRASRIINEQVVAFLDHHLKGKSATSPTIGAAACPEVQIEDYDERP
jgi:dienelactone hydrolase